MICDMCGKEKETETATVTIRGKTWALTLCETDADTLASLAQQGSVGPRKGPSKPVTKPTQHRVEPIA